MYIIMFLISFIGIQVYRNTQVTGNTIINSDNEISAEVVLTENNLKSEIPEEILSETEIEVDTKDLDLANLVKTNIVEKEVTVPKEVVVTKIQSEIKTEVIGKFTVVGYCNCSVCNENKVGKDIMSNYKGVNATSNPNEIPYGTKIWIDGVGIRQTQPSGQKLTQNEVKIYFSTHEEVVNFGTQTLEIHKVVD